MIDNYNIINNSFSSVDKNSRTFIFIEPYGAAISLLKRGIDNGYNIIILTANSDLRIVPKSIIELSKFCIQIDTLNEDLLIQLISELKKFITIDGIIPGFEYFVPIANKISNYLGLPSIKTNDILKLRRKDLMRQAMQKANLRIL